MPSYSSVGSAKTSKRHVISRPLSTPPLTGSPQIVSTDDYMPMAINSLDEYQKVINVSWYTPEQPAENLTYVVAVYSVSYHC